MKFSELAHVFETLEHTDSRLEMTEVLAELFASTTPEEIGKICYLLQGRVAPKYEATEFGVATKFMVRAIAQACEVEHAEVTSLFKKTGDVGIAVQEMMRQSVRASERQESISVEDVFRTLKRITETHGEGSQEKKIGLIADLLKRVDPLSARFIVRIPLGKLRLGFSDMTILDALSWMLTSDKSKRGDIESAYNLRPDIGVVAEAIRKDSLSGLRHINATLGVPVLAALCQRLPTADEMISKMGTVAVEPKFDGIRVQIHYKKRDTKHVTRDTKKKIGESNMSHVTCHVSAFSRNLENTTEMYPELEEIGGQLNASSVILDAEAIGIDPKTGNHVPFQQTTTRKRKHGIADARKVVPLKFYVFDILYKDGNDLLGQPLSKRRDILKKTIKKGSILEITEQEVVDTADKVRSFHDVQRKKGLEGAVVKKWDAPYEPGRRGYSWVKFKEEEGTTGRLQDTIDTVIMGYYYGEGKRSGFGIGAFLVGVRDGDEVVTVTKIGTGVTDDQWKDLIKRLRPLETKKKPKEYKEPEKTLLPDVWVEPVLVAEIAGDDLTVSKTHGANYAVRFPRLIRLRDDRSASDATTINELVEMYKQQ